jgi:hypothetical protein
MGRIAVSRPLWETVLVGIIRRFAFCPKYFRARHFFGGGQEVFPEKRTFLESVKQLRLHPPNWSSVFCGRHNALAATVFNTGSLSV